MAVANTRAYHYSGKKVLWYRPHINCKLVTSLTEKPTWKNPLFFNLFIFYHKSFSICAGKIPVNLVLENEAITSNMPDTSEI